MKFLIFMMVALSNISNVFADENFDKSAWNGANKPSFMSTNFETNYKSLPKRGSLKSKGLGWPGHYWPNKYGGVSQRWNARYPDHFKYTSPSKYEARTMTEHEINSLSPAEKYDLYVGDYSYSTVELVRSQTNRWAKIWHGICNGVAPASLNHPEPKTVTVYNPDGIKITFYVSDVKALLAYYYAKVDNSSAHQVGKRCFFSGRNFLLNQINGCKDVNAGSFHIILANKLGISKTGFIADIDRYKEVWNHAALEYNSIELGRSARTRDSAENTFYRVLVKTTVKYAASIDPHHNQVIGTNKAKYDVRTYIYWLELDYNNNIVGGEWQSRQRPDFLWFKNKVTFKGHFSKINEIYQTNY